MIINLLTGAHAVLIPYVTALYDELAAPESIDIDQFVGTLEKVLEHDLEDWAEDLLTDALIDIFQKLPTPVLMDISQNMKLHDGIPLRLCLYLMDKNDQLAAEVIEKTDILDTTDLIYRVNSGQMGELISIAKRKNLSTEVLCALIECQNPRVYVELLKNPSVAVRSDVVRHLTECLENSALAAWEEANSVESSSKMARSRQNAF